MLLIWAVVVWVVGLVTIVPVGTYYLFFHAEREHYALLITLVLFWIFGYWGVVGPLLAAIKTRRFFRSLEQAQEEGKLKEALHSQEAEDVLVDFLATENHIPRFLARRMFRFVARRLSARAAKSDEAVEAELLDEREG